MADADAITRRPRYRAKHLNRSSIHDYVLRRAEQLGRGDVVKRVGDEVYVWLDAIVETKLTEIIRQHPSKFKTLQPYTPPKRHKEP